MEVEPNGLPNLQVRNDIASAVHDGVCAVTNSSGYRRCQLEALTASMVASAVTGTGYEFVAVETRIWRHEGNAERWTFDGEYFDPYIGKRDMLHIEHCWAEDKADTGVIIDTSAWQYKKYFANKWQINNWEWTPIYYWGFLRDVPCRYQQWYQGWLDLTESLREKLARERGKEIKAIANHAFKRLAEKGYRRTDASCALPAWWKKLEEERSWEPYRPPPMGNIIIRDGFGRPTYFI